MALDPRRVKALFNSALDLPDLAGRSAFLDRECGDDDELRRRLDELLAAHDHPAGALERPLAGSPETVTSADDEIADSGPPATEGERTASISDPAASYRTGPPSPLIDSVIAGRYKLRQEIGEGGMGTVFLADQMQPVRRQVALKLIKAGMDSKTVLARFESERQALALMDHPHIARVLDAGSTDAGRPFFVMELVKGIPLTDYCDQHRLGLPERLSLFRQICSAVQHAHQKGIIHRDLKPTNILVESHDGHPVPKVIDFGLAKATSGLQLSEHSLYSAFGTVAGTPCYMAPEQASFNALDVDTRADIYGLGVILYELLTGSTPIPRETLKRAALDEMLRMVREVEPPTPSSRVSTSDGLPGLAAARHIEPQRLSRFIRGDLDWIVMKALAKERHRRYESAIGLANDIERFTNHEPVSAGPPTATYRFRKFVRRNRGRVFAASLVLLALVGGVVGTSMGLAEANRQRGIAVARRKEAEKRLGQKDKPNEILLSIFRDLNPYKDSDKETLPLSDRLGRRLDQATAALEGEATDDPLGVARMQAALGTSQLGLGYAEKAIVLLTKARATFMSRLGPVHPDTLQAMNMLANAYRAAGKPDRSVALLEEALTKARLGPDHPETLLTMSNLAMGYRSVGKLDRAVPLYEEALALTKSRLGPDHPDTIKLMNHLAQGYSSVGKLDRAIPLQEEALAKARLGPDHPLTLGTMNSLAMSYMGAGKPDRAIPLHEEALALAKTRLGPDHPDTLQAMNVLAGGYRFVGKLDRAVPLWEEALALRKARLGPDHPDTLQAMADLASAYQYGGKQPDRAIPLWEEALALRKARHGPDHPATLGTVNYLANAYLSFGKPDRAIPLWEETLALVKSSLGPDHPNTLSIMDNLATGYWSLGKLDRSIPLYEEALRLRAAKSGTDHLETWNARGWLGAIYLDAGRLGEALPLLEGVARASREHPQLRMHASRLQNAYVRAGQPDKAAALAREMLAEARATTPAGSHTRASILGWVGLTLLEVEAWDEAEPVLRECLAIREEAAPDEWFTPNTRSMLGEALLGQEKYAEAEPLLRSGYEGMTQRADKIPPQAKLSRLGAALDRLIALAEATGKADEAKAWKEERAKFPVAAPPKLAKEGR
ncbi:tetratricopeptide repeat protein [Isosphaeraceae bacterium EP7]